MVKLALSKWSTVLEQCTVISLWGKPELYISYIAREIYFYTTFRVGCSHIIRKDGKN